MLAEQLRMARLTGYSKSASGQQHGWHPTQEPWVCLLPASNQKVRATHVHEVLASCSCCTHVRAKLQPYLQLLHPRDDGVRVASSPAGLGCPHKLWDPGAAYIHSQRVAQWSDAKEDRAVPPLHAPTDTSIYHAHGAETFPDSDTAR